MKKVYIIHGWTYSTEKYEELNELLKARGLKTVMVKVPGLTEKLDTEKAWGIGDYVKWLKKTLDREKAKIILIGHSNGGRIALNFTIKYPRKVSNLILMNSAGIYRNELHIRMKRLFFSTLARIGKKITKSQILRNLLYKLTGESNYRDASSHMGKTMINLIQSDMSLSLSKISVPTLIIWGENDKTLPLRDGKKMHELIKNSTLQIIKGARHAPQFTHAEEVGKIIYEYI